MADSHYVAQLLLRNWEHPPGSLRYYDFELGRIKKGSAKSTFVSDSPFPDGVEKRLGREIETALGEYLAWCKKERAGVLSDPQQLLQRRAIVLALFTQAARTRFASVGHGLDDVEAILSGGETAIEQFVRAAHEHFQVVGLNLPADERLFLPSSGIAPLPLEVVSGWFLPVTPHALIAVVPKGATVENLERIREAGHLFQAYSVGALGSKVVIPPTVPKTDLSGIAQYIRVTRPQVRELVGLVNGANAIVPLGTSARSDQRYSIGAGRSGSEDPRPMGTKLEVQTIGGEPRWCLDGRPVGHEILVMVRKGAEIHGVIGLDGHEPPGTPIFAYRLFGVEESKVVKVHPETDLFRRQFPAEVGESPSCIS